jgi:hypothetical protein
MGKSRKNKFDRDEDFGNQDHRKNIDLLRLEKFDIFAKGVHISDDDLSLPKKNNRKR